MLEIPLFPLNTVLFPGMQLKLHIFEERYKLMIRACIDDNVPFGVVLIESGRESLGPLARPHMVGCMAHIAHVQRLRDGRMNVIVVGRERFKLQTLTHDKPYLVGKGKLFPLKDNNRNATLQRAQKLRQLVERYLTALGKAGQVEFDAEHIPLDPKLLAYLSAIVIQTDTAHKQELLATTTTNKLLKNLIHAYRNEIALLEFMLSPPEDDSALCLN